MPKRVGLNSIRTNVRRRADMENSQFVSDAEVDDYVNHAWNELYDIIIQNYEEDYFLKNSDITLVSDTESYDLPSDFYKARGVDYKNGNDYMPIHRYNFSERSRSASSLKYRIQGEKIFFSPTPTSSDTIRIWYIPNPRLLEFTSATIVATGSNTTYTTDPKNYVAGDYLLGEDFLPATYNVEQKIVSVTATTVVTDLDSSALGAVTNFGKLNLMMDGYSGWDEFVIVDAAIRCLVKEESDIGPLVGHKSSLVKRINGASNIRDAGEPTTVTDVSAYDNLYVI